MVRSEKPSSKDVDLIHTLAELFLQGIVVNQDHQVEYVSPSFVRMIGVSETNFDSWTYNDFLDLIADEDKSHVDLTFSSVFSGKRTSEKTEFCLLRADGKSMQVQADVRAIRDNGKMTIYVAFTEVRIQRKSLEHPYRTEQEQLKESESRWRSFVENAPDIIMTVNQDGILRYQGGCRAKLRAEQDSWLFISS